MTSLSRSLRELNTSEQIKCYVTSTESGSQMSWGSGGPSTDSSVGNVQAPC